MASHQDNPYYSILKITLLLLYICHCAIVPLLKQSAIARNSASDAMKYINASVGQRNCVTGNKELPFHVSC